MSVKECKDEFGLASRCNLNLNLLSNLSATQQPFFWKVRNELFRILDRCKKYSQCTSTSACCEYFEGITMMIKQRWLNKWPHILSKGASWLLRSYPSQKFSSSKWVGEHFLPPLWSARRAITGHSLESRTRHKSQQRSGREHGFNPGSAWWAAAARAGGTGWPTWPAAAAAAATPGPHASLWLGLFG